MKKLQFTTILTLASLIISLIIPTQSKIHAETIQSETQNTQKDYGKFPMLFEQNKGQTEKTAKFISRGKGYTLYLAETQAVFQLRKKQVQSPKSKVRSPKTNSDTLRMNFVNANTNPTISGTDEAVTKTNYYIGKSKFENLSNYHKVNYRNIYKGIDAVFYGNQGNLEYDFNILPNSDATQIKLNFDGAKNISINENGDLILKTENAELTQHKPVAYQIINDERKEVAVSYKLTENQISFELGEYDKSQVLTIDPVLSYLTYFGGSGGEYVGDIKVDSEGNAFVAGSTESTNFPGPNSGSGNIDFAAYVSKISPDGQTILYTTFLDGNNNDGQSTFNVGFIRPDIAIDGNGNAYIAGGTDSRDFPVTSNAFQTRRGGIGLTPTGFVTKLNAQGNIVYSTYFGGNDADYLHSIAVDSAGKAYVCGATASGFTFPSKNEYQGSGVFGGLYDAFLTVFNASGSDIVYSTKFGGSGSDFGSEIALDSANNVYITGETASNSSFPIKNAFQTANGGGKDAFVAKFNTSLSGEPSLVYSTFLGGVGTDTGFGIAVNSGNQAVVVGLTGSVNFPLQNAFRSTNQINEGFVTVLNSNGNGLVNSSFLGGADQDEALDVALGNNGLIYVTGDTLSNNFPTSLPFQATKGTGRDAFITKLKFGSGIISSSYLGGNGNDFGFGIAIKGNSIFAVGQTVSNNLATTSGVIAPNFGGGSDGFIAKILDTAVDSVGVFRPSTTFQITQSTTNIVSQSATFTSLLSGAKGVSGDFDGDGITTIGSFTNGTWKLRNVNFPFINPLGVTTLNFGLAGDLPVVGDWDGDGVDTVGTFRPSTGQFFLTNQTNASAINVTLQFGTAGDLPIGGDWNGDGIDTVAVYRPSTGQTFFTNQNVPNPPIDFVANLGIAEDLPIGGDWNGDGKDSLGLRRPSTNEFFLSDDNINLRPVFLFGQIGDQPIAGDWDGLP
jgi:Beta-propeller repeat